MFGGIRSGNRGAVRRQSFGQISVIRPYSARPVWRHLQGQYGGDHKVFRSQHTVFVRHRPRQFTAFVRRRQVNLVATGAVSSRLWFTFGVVSAQCPFTFGFAVSRFLLSVAWPTRGICSQSAKTFYDNSCDQTVDIRFRQQMYSLELD